MSSRQDRKQEQLCVMVREENALLLADFADWLLDTHLSKKAIQQHVQDVEMFITMLSDQAITALGGVNCVAEFLGRNSIEANPNSLLKQAVSLKKFYTYMNEEGRTNDEELQEVKETIKIGMPGWLAKVGLHGPEDTEPQKM
jgi:site-specific recombinase XerD